MSPDFYGNVIRFVIKLVAINVPGHLLCAVLVAPEGHLFKSNLKHEIQVRADEHALPGTLKAVESIWSKIGEILDEGFELCEATAFCSCTPPAEPMTEQEDFCGYCLKDGEETK